MINQCVTPSGSVTNDNEANCTLNGYCKSDSTNLYYNVKTNASCIKPNNFGICEVCDEGSHCLKLPIGDYCQVSNEKLQYFIGIYFVFLSFSVNFFFEDCSYARSATDEPFEWNEILNACIFPSYTQSQCYCGTGNASYHLCQEG